MSTQPTSGTEGFRYQAPRVADALKKGSSVSVTTWSGHKMVGTVSDRDPAGLLLQVEEGGNGYSFLPWSSVEQVDIPEVSPRQVKFLPG